MMPTDAAGARRRRARDGLPRRARPPTCWRTTSGRPGGPARCTSGCSRRDATPTRRHPATRPRSRRRCRTLDRRVAASCGASTCCGRRTPLTSRRRRRAPSCSVAAATCRSGRAGTAGSRPPSYSLTTPPLLGWLGPVWLGALSIVATGAGRRAACCATRRATAARRGVPWSLAAGFDVVSGRTTFAVGALVALAALLAAERSRVVGRGAARCRSPPRPARSPGSCCWSSRRARPSLTPSGVAPAFGMGAGGRRRLGADRLAVARRWRRDTSRSRGRRCSWPPAPPLVVIVAPVGAPGPDCRLALTICVACRGLLRALADRCERAPGSPCSRRRRRSSRAARMRSRCALGGARRAGLAACRSRSCTTTSRRAAATTPRGHSSLRCSPSWRMIPLRADRRVEVVDTATHWPSTYLLPHVALARGWERQVDETRNPMFYGRAPLTAQSYRGFLDRNAVGAGRSAAWASRSTTARRVRRR